MTQLGIESLSHRPLANIVPLGYVIFVNFLSVLSEFDSERYMSLIRNMKKKKVKHLVFKLGYNFAS